MRWRCPPELGWIAVGEATELHEQKLVDPLAGSSFGRFLIRRPKAAFLVTHGHVLEGRVVAEAKAAPRLLRRGQVHVLAEAETMPAVGAPRGPRSACRRVDFPLLPLGPSSAVEAASRKGDVVEATKSPNRFSTSQSLSTTATSTSARGA